jgi:GTPase SAR1 family protein
MCRQNLIAERLHIGQLLLSLVRHYLLNRNVLFSLTAYPSEPTVFENYVHDLYVGDQLVELSLWDTAGMSTFISF